jgi:predicted ATPase
VLTLDDVQWADETTLDLVRQCAVESSTSQMLLLLCCRSDGVGDSSRLVESFLKPILSDSEACQVQEIRLEQLTMKQTKEFMTMLLSVSPSEPETTNLANFLHRSTAGNPFYLVSFVPSLVDNALLSFDLGASTWVWDLNEIKMTTTITDNVVDVVKKKLMRSKEARSLLPIAATLGAEFSEGTLASICAAISGTKPPLLHKMGLWAMPLPSEMKSWLCACEEDGFLNNIQVKDKDRERYKFVHDCIQEASLALLSTSELNNLQRQVGQILASEIIDAPILDGKGSVLPCTNSSIIFTAVNLLNIQGGELTDDFSSHQLILLNHAAGTLAMAKASFQLASGYFEQAIDLLRDEDWTNQLCSKVHEGAVLAAYSDGNTQELHAQALMLRDDVPLLNKVTTYHTMSQSLQSRERSEEALRLNMHLLAQLGVRFPRN